MTDNKIIKAWECCVIKCSCVGCPYKKDWQSFSSQCIDKRLEDTFALITRQKAEIEMLQYANEVNVASCGTLHERLKTAKAEAIKEFADRLKATPMRFYVEYVEYFDRPSVDKMVLFIDDNDIDSLVKEMG
jgi:hypothetical protein